jgi:predicted Holliday junction resolvase-like endonuclease
MDISIILIGIVILFAIVLAAKLYLQQQTINSLELLYNTTNSKYLNLLEKKASDDNHFLETLSRIAAEADEEVQRSFKDGEAFGRKDALKRSAAVNHGFSSENFAPLLTKWSHKDFRHMGDPIDYLVVPGMSDSRQASSPIEEVILLDIKTGSSQLNAIQRKIRDAVKNGKVRFAVFNPDTQETRFWPPYQEELPIQLELPFNVK